MTPELKFHSIVISSTTAIVFSAWVLLNSIIVNYPLAAVVLSGFVSLGIYRFLVIFLLSIFRNVRFFKKFVLGPSFMEGLWVGFFVGNKNKIRLFVEIFEQDISSTTIRGRAFRDDGTYHGSWIAENVTIDINKAKLTYHYQTDAIGNTFINPGIASFEMERQGRNKPPVKLIGFSSDLYSPYKLMAMEDKISEKTMIDCSEAFQKAKEVHKKYEMHVPSMLVSQKS